MSDHRPWSIPYSRWRRHFGVNVQHRPSLNPDNLPHSSPAAEQHADEISPAGRFNHSQITE